jgi:hypothetical protein
VCLCGFSNVCVCVGFVMYVFVRVLKCVSVLVIRIPYSGIFLNLTEVYITLTEVFPCFFLSCKANARIKLTKTRHGPHSSTLVVICVVRLLFVLFYVLFVCKCVLPPGDNPTAVNKCIISYHIRLRTNSYGAEISAENSAHDNYHILSLKRRSDRL